MRCTDCGFYECALRATLGGCPNGETAESLGIITTPNTRPHDLDHAPFEKGYQPSGIKLTWKDICRICEVAAGMLEKNINEELMGRYESPQEFYEKVLEKL